MIRELGRGGGGVVYLARDARLDRLAAVKVVLHGSHAGATHLARFRAETLAIAHLAHPGVVQVYQVGETAGLPFCAMEYVTGGNLRQRMATGTVPAREAAVLVERLARTMHAVHDAGFVHRDLKPENILIGTDGTPKVADFGLVLQVHRDGADEPNDSLRLTHSGEVMGTPCYMAPEQVVGHGSRIGPATDVYALGVILYELLTGRPPFLAGMATFIHILSYEPTGPRRYTPDLPRDLETVCLKCLRKSPGDRYPVAADLADDLRRFLDGRPVNARPVGPLYRAWRWARRNPRPAALMATVAVLVVALAVGGPVMAYQQSRLTDALDKEKSTLLEANAREQVARQASETSAAEAKAAAALARRTADGLLAAVGSDLLFITDIPPFKRRALDVALTVYEQSLRTGIDDPDARLGLALTLLRVGPLHIEAGAVPAGITALRDGVDRLRAAEGERPADPTLRRTLALGRFRLGLALDRDGQERAAKDEIDRATALLRALTQDPQVLEARVGRANQIWLGAYALGYDQSPAAAEGVLWAALDEVAPLVAEFPTPESRRVLGKVQGDLGIVRDLRGATADGEKWLRRSISTIGGLVVESPDNHLYQEDLAHARRHLAHVIFERPAEALPILKDSLAAWVSLNRGRTDTRYLPDESKTRLLLGGTLRRLGQPADAEAEYRAAIRLLERLLEDQPLSPYHPSSYADCLIELAEVRAAAGGPRAGLDILDPAVRKLAPYFQYTGLRKISDESAIVAFVVRRAEFLAALGRHRESAEELKRAADHPHATDRTTLWTRRCLALARAGDWEESVTMADDMAQDNGLTADALVYLARVYAVADSRAKDDAQRSRRAGRALTLLQRAHKAGAFKDATAAKTLARDPDFRPLARSDEFLQFLATINPSGSAGKLGDGVRK